MAAQLGGFGVPGMGTLELSTPRELLWGGDNRGIQALWINALISGATRDAGNDPTTVLRSGLLLGKITATGKLIQWDATAVDGSQEIAGILDVSNLKATDYNATNADRWLRALVRGPLLASQLLIKGSAMVGHADEYLARRMLVAAGIILDDDPFGHKAGRERAPVYKAESFSVTAADNGTTFFVAGNYTATLPALKPGLEFTFVGAADAGWLVASAEGDNIIVLNDVAADAVDFITSSEKIGAIIKVRSDYVNGTAKWVACPLVGSTTLYT